LYGSYWSSEPELNYSNDVAWILYFNSGGHNTYYDGWRFYGKPVRPVQGFTK
jgi:hypothetical protein